MRKKERLAIYFAYILIFAAISAYNAIAGSQWIIDSLIALMLMASMFFADRWLKMGRGGLTLFGLALLIHNMGAFGWYEWKLGFLAYDNVVHFVSSIVGAYIIFNFVARKLHVTKRQRVGRTVVDEHRAIFIFLVIASVAMLGTIVELIEFFGFMFLGPGDGILFTGPGDSGHTKDIAAQYTDTMGDIIVNILGTLVGVLLYYSIKYKKQPWLQY